MTDQTTDRPPMRFEWYHLAFAAVSAATLGAVGAGAAMYFGPVVSRDGVISQYEADVLRAASYHGVSILNVPRSGYVYEGTAPFLEGDTVSMRESSTGCTYHGEVKRSMSKDRLIADLREERCPSLTGPISQQVRFLASLGDGSTDPEEGREIAIYRQPKLVGGMAMPDADFVQDQMQTLSKIADGLCDDVMGAQKSAVCHEKKLKAEGNDDE